MAIKTGDENSEPFHINYLLKHPNGKCSINFGVVSEVGQKMAIQSVDMKTVSHFKEIIFLNIQVIASMNEIFHLYILICFIIKLI